VFELLPQAALRVDAAGRLVDRNELAAAMSGPSGPLGSSDLAGALQGVRGFPEWLAGEGGPLFRGRLQAQRSNGVPVTVEVDARRLPGDAGGALCTLRELDRLRVAEEAQRYFDVAFDAAPIGMALFNTDGEYVRVNAALCAFLGRGPEDLLGRRDQEFTHPDDRQSDIDAAWRILRGEIHTWQCEKRFVRPDGSRVWAIANLTFLRDADGNPMTWVGQFQDITHRKRLEVDLSQREQRTRQILESAHDAFVSIDGQERVVEWNPQAESLFGWARHEVLGTDLIGAIIPERDHEAHRRSIALLLGGDRTILGRLFEITAAHLEGREFPVELTISAHVRGSEPVFYAFLRDISDRKRTEKRLLMAHAAAVEASRLKSAFVANISPEIRTPLNGVIGTSMLLLETPLDDEQREYVDALRASGDALMTLVDDILDFSKIEAGKLEIGVEPFDVRDVVEEVAAIFAAAAHAKGIELVSWVDDDVPAALLGDRHRIRQVLANLVGNAVKFTTAGEVSVSVSGRPESAGTVGLHIEVADTGVGIEPQALERIFESFSQGDGSTTRRFGGT
ncbi:MAG: PAS domain S-box protein, partial [Actinomycetota bacterium]